MDQEAIELFYKMAKSYGWSDEKIEASLKEAERIRNEQKGRDIYYDGYETLTAFESSITIKYDSPPSEPTVRTVDVKKIVLSSGGELCIGGFCRLRKDERIFRIDRVLSAHIGETEIDIKNVVFDKLEKTPGAIKKIANFRGLRFCFTGTLCSMPRRKAEEKIEALGGTFSRSIDHRTHFLVSGEKKESGSLKLKEAEELGVPIISEEKFLEFLEHPDKAQAEKTTERNPRKPAPIASFWRTDIIPLNKKRAIIVYVDKSGEEAERDIAMNYLKFKDNGDMIISAYSYTEKGPRSFLVNNIKKLSVDGIKHDPAWYFDRVASGDTPAAPSASDMAQEALRD
jgi:hypothetical protein